MLSKADRRGPKTGLPALHTPTSESINIMTVPAFPLPL